MEETLPTLAVANQRSFIDPWLPSGFLLVALVCVLLTWSLQTLWTRRRFYKYSRNLPGPTAFPIVGSALRFLGSPYDIFSTMMQMFRDYPEIFRIWYLSRLFYAISDPKCYAVLFTHSLRKDHWYDYAKPAVGEGLIVAPLDKWRRHRKIIAPTFSQKIIDGFVGTFSKQSEILVEQLKKIAGGGEVDIFDTMSKCTIDTICETLMGVNVNTQSGDVTPVSRWIDRIMEIIFLRLFVFWRQFDAIFNRTPLSKHFQGALNKFHSFSSLVGAKTIFLDHLIEITRGGGQLTEQQLKDEVDTFIITGSDATASINSFVLIMLGIHQDLQARVYEEIMEVVGPDRAVMTKDLVKLQYLERFIQETLRLFPVAAFTIRGVDEDVDLGGHVVPKEAAVIFGILRTHTNEKYWPDPFKFDPERFVPEEVAKRHPCTYLPFSYGPRNCIGKTYAMVFMKTLLATVVRKFKFHTSYESVQDIKLKAHILLRPRDGYKIYLKLR